ncbi:major royal jelly protein 1-like [Diprion similis]|uniref:major royal jelly protein 1-like n=1 Tax=Diprion similis TaxID=362088 RepID=UPI001EF91BC2|nr:major royal jelly protein 1-like [Diprion similis]
MNLILTGILAFLAWTATAELEIVYNWTYVNYTWPNDTSEETAVAAGKYNTTNIIVCDFDVIGIYNRFVNTNLQPVINGLPGDDVFVVTPRYNDNPASLSRVSNQTGDGGPLLEPYPSWDWHTSENCSGITSVNRIAKDNCNRLWMVDSGKIGDDQICPAQLLAFNVTTDNLLLRKEVSDNLTHNSQDSSRGWIEIQQVITEGDSCENVTVFMGDPEGYGMVIWNGVDMWRIQKEFFAPNETGFDNDTVLRKEWGISNYVYLPNTFAVGPFLMFGPLLSYEIYVVPVSDLRNEDSNITFYKSNRTLPTMVTTRIVTDSGILMGGYVGWQCITCWNVQNPIALEYIVNLTGNSLGQDTFSAKSVKRSDSDNEEYWQITSTVPKYSPFTLNISNINFVISYSDVVSLVNGTACEVQETSSNRTIGDTNFLPYED